MPQTTRNASIAILGSGLQGCCIALELARRNIPTTIYEQDGLPFNRASRRNEGKIHFGLVYANEPDFSTAELQLQGALRFYPLLRKWCGDLAFPAYSTPFAYLVARDSVLSASELEAHYEKLDRRYRECIEDDPGLSYLGLRPSHLYSPEPRNDTSRHFEQDLLQAVVPTEERAVDTEGLRDMLCAAVDANPLIRLKTRHEVKEISRTSTGYTIEGVNGSGTWTAPANQVVNCTWHNRLALDATLGLQPRPGWLHRMKYRVIAEIDPGLCELPSATMVLGRYGDVVVRPDATCYLSWYPTGMRGWCKELSPPRDWDRPCTGVVEDPLREEIVSGFLDNTLQWYPGLKVRKILAVDAGVIFAYGKTDVDDRQSALHGRSASGVSSHGGYHSVDTGKLTTAPLFAVQAADAVEAAHC